MGKYRPAVILTLALTVFLASCKGTSDDPVTPGPDPTPGKSWVVSTLVAGSIPPKFSFPSGVAVDSSGNIYVADTGYSRIRKIVVANDGTTTVSTIAGSGPTRFRNPTDVAVDSSDNLYVADTGNNLIRKITFTTVDDVVTATISTVAGDGTANFSDNDTATAAQFDSPYGVAVDSSGNLYVADKDNNRIRKIAVDNAGVVGAVSTIAGTATAGNADTVAAGADPGLNPAVVGTFNSPQGIAVDPSGENLYVAGTVSHTIRKVLISTGAVSTIAGTADSSGTANGYGTEARFDSPYDVAVDSDGNLYVADTVNHRIRKIVISTGEVTTFAGSGTEGFADGAAATAGFNGPSGIAVDSSGNVYVAGQWYNAIRKIEYK